MATSAFAPPQPKQERVNPRDMIGGTFEYIYDSILGTGSVNESPVRSPEILDAERGWVEKGSLSNFQTARRKEYVFPQLRLKRLQSEVAAAYQETQTAQPLKQKRIEVNSAIGIGNVEYEDTVDDDGQERIDVEVYLERRNSELQTNELKAKRKEQLVAARKKATSPKGAIGPQVNMNTTFEDRNMSNPG